jgi:hypothetical protein
MMIEPHNIFVSGQTGSGKSWLTKRAVLESPRLVVYQPKVEDAGYAGVYFNGRKFEWQCFLAWWKYARSRCNRWRLVYRPSNKFSGDEFDQVCRLVHAAGDCDFVAEEIADYLRAGMFQVEGRYQGIRDMICTSRTRGVTAYWLTQRPRGIPREITSESREAYLFKTEEPVDVKYIADRFGLQAAEMLAALAPYEHVHWRLGEPPIVEKT